MANRSWIIAFAAALLALLATPAAAVVHSVSAAATVAFLEGPAWCSADGYLYFSDIAANAIMRFSPLLDSEPGPVGITAHVWKADSGRSNGLAFDTAGRMLVCQGADGGPRRLARLSMVDGQLDVLADSYKGKALNSPNDVVPRADGRSAYFSDPRYGDRTDMQLDEECVFLWRQGQPLICVDNTLARPNGVALSPDEQTLYIVTNDNTPAGVGTRGVWTLAVDAASGLPLPGASPKRIIDFASGRGGDGMCVDSEGRLYVAAGVNSAAFRTNGEDLTVPAGLHVYNATGGRLGFVDVPEDVITNCAFGGADGRTLYITAGKTVYTLQQPDSWPEATQPRRPAVMDEEEAADIHSWTLFHRGEEADDEL